MRPLIQYDLDEPLPGSSASVPHPNTQPPTKKRKWNHHNGQKTVGGPPPRAKAPVPVQHWDDPGSTAIGVVYDEASAAPSYEEGEGTANWDDGADVDAGADQEDEGEREEGEEEEEEEEEESRLLTHEEIWDDSALIDAWNSAQAEYEAYHGASKAWKTESVKKSPLWYNKPCTAPKPRPSKPRPRAGDDEPDTAPLDFATYVPTHDPSLASVAPPAPTVPAAPFFVPPPSTLTVSRDEAFNNALSAMYWSGYWTAVYHCQGQGQSSGPAETTEEDAIEADEEIQDLVPTQR